MQQSNYRASSLFQSICLFICLCLLVGWLVVFNVPSTARSFRDGTPIYCPLRRTWSSINTPFRPGIEPRAVAWQSITLPLRYASSTCLCLTSLLNIWGHIATVPTCSNGTLTNVLPNRNAIPQTQDMIPRPVTVYRHRTWHLTPSQYTDTGHDIPPRHSIDTGQDTPPRHSIQYTFIFTRILEPRNIRLPDSKTA